MSRQRNQPVDPIADDAPEPKDDPAAEGEALIEAAERKRRRPKPEAVENGSEDVLADAVPPSTRRRRKRNPVAPREATSPTEPGDPDHATALAGIDPKPKGPSAWTAVCVCAALAVAVLTASAAASLPQPLPVENQVNVIWLDGPRVPQREVDGWLATFPKADELAEANAWVLNKLSEHLLAQPEVKEVRRISIVHQAVSGAGKSRLGRVLNIEMAMRSPYMPGVLTSGQRVWVDSDGVVLRGNLAGPDQHRPLLRGIEDGSVNLRAAVDAWKRVGNQLDPGSVTDIDCNGVLDDLGARGIVMTARGGAHLIWGRQDDDRIGPNADIKARNLVHTLRCQGDLGRLEMVNVRFAEPVFTLKRD